MKIVLNSVEIEEAIIRYVSQSLDVSYEELIKEKPILEINTSSIYPKDIDDNDIIKINFDDARVTLNLDIFSNK